MPLSLMGPAVQTVAHFVPTYWVNDAIGKALAADLTSTVLGDIACDLGVTVLFAAAIAAVGLALARSKSQPSHLVIGYSLGTDLNDQEWSLGTDLND